MTPAASSPSLAAARRRSARRARAGGAVMFIVAMTIAVLASVGIYALAAASNEVSTSGNERQSTQTHYLAEYGVLAAAHEVVGAKSGMYFAMMMQSPDTGCLSLPNVPTTAPAQTQACRKMASSELAQTWATTPTIAYTGNTPFAAGATPGSFGTVPMNGDFYVELTDPTKMSSPPRFSQDNSFCVIQFTATSIGYTQPLSATTPGAPLYENEGMETERARIMAGPIQCPR